MMDGKVKLSNDTSGMNDSAADFYKESLRFSSVSWVTVNAWCVWSISLFKRLRPGARRTGFFIFFYKPTVAL